MAWMRLVRVFQKVERMSADHLRCRELSIAQFDVLAKVGAAEGSTQQEVADSLLVTKGNVCQLLDRMEKSGLLVRKQDGRSNRLFLTDTGRKLFADVIPAHEQAIARMFSPLTADEQAQLLALLRKLDHALQ
jgi:DNA-binding MarR family transcriptional regulator